MSEQCLELKNVCKSFRDFTLNNISFTLPQGYIMGLVGPNGAGKTTTIQLILNMLEKDAGRILAFGKDNVVSEKEIKQDIGIVFDSIFYVDTELKNFPLFCPKCRQETLIHVKQFNITVIKEPDAQTQSR